MMRLKRWSGVIVLSAGAACTGAMAQNYPSEQDYLQEFPVVLSASRLSQPLSEAPNAMTVIDRGMIVASGFRSIADLFKLVPGMYVGYYHGSQPFVAYHGSTDQYARRMQVLIDGRSVYLPPVSMVDWSNLPITVDDIERIEVIRGPAAASHGANSLQGVISITTRGADQVEGKTVSFTRGSKGINDAAAYFGKRGETLDYRMTVAYTADNGYDGQTSPPNGYPITKFQADTLINNSNDSNQARMVNLRANYHPDGVNSFDAQFGFNHDIQGVGFWDSAKDPFHDVISNAGFLQLDWTHQTDVASELKLRYYHIRQDQSESFTHTSGTVSAVQTSQVERDEMELQHTLQFGDNNRLVYGAGWRRDQIDARGYSTSAPTFYSSALTMDEYRLFAHDEWRITPRLLLNTGAMFEHDRMGFQGWSPRVALNFHLTPEHTIRAGASMAYRTPSLVEERFRASLPGVLFIPNQNVTFAGLKPERILSREIGYLGEFHDWDASLDLRLFSDEVGDGVYIRSAPTAFTNGVSSRYQGLEATFKKSFGKDSDLTANFAHELASSNGPALLAAGHGSMSSKDPSDNDILSASTPENSASLLYAHRWANGISGSVSCYYQGALQPYDRGAIDYQPIQRRADIRIAKAFQPSAGVEGEVSVVVQNLLSTDYTEYIASNLFKRRAWFNATLKF